MLYACFAILAETGYYYLIFGVLLAGNIFNLVWGEFTCEELKAELKTFYSTETGLFIKRVSGLFLVAFFFWGVWFVLTKDLSPLNLIPFSVIFGLFAGCFNVTLAHDLLHSNHKFDTFLASLLLLFTNIPHLAVDHVYGHHRTVALKHDPSTAKVNQSFYSFFFIAARSRLEGVYLNGYGLPGYARKRIFKLGRRMLFLQIMVWVFLVFMVPKGEIAFVFFIVQGFTAYLLYELINYIQHYGLSRKTTESPVLQKHSWNCYYKYTNFILYMLPLHSLHHSAKPEQKKAWNNLKGGPKMPYLYFVMIALAVVPPLWFKVMNKRIPE